jgi:probable phosphoglycerate mutase
MRLILVRHGTVFGPGEGKRYLGVSQDPSLSAAGRARIEEAARAVLRDGHRPEAIISGPALRQRETADILAWVLATPEPVVEPALTEIDYGPWEGLAAEEVARRWPAELHGWKKKGVWPAGLFGGSFEALKSDLAAWLKHVAAWRPDGAVLAVTSQGTLRGLYAAVDPRGWAALCAEGRVTATNVDYGGRCLLDVMPDSAAIRSWNVA